MRLRRLSLASMAGCVLGLVLLGALGVHQLQRMQTLQGEMAELLELQARIDQFNAASDSLWLLRADDGLWQAFRRDARELQGTLQRLELQGATPESAARRIDIMIETLTRARARGLDTDELADSTRILLNNLSMQGMALDAALDSTLRARRRAIANQANRSAILFAGAALLFGGVCFAAFGLIHRRISGPVRDLLATVDDLRAGRANARTTVTGGDELGELGRALNRLARRRQAADTRIREQHEALARRERMLAESQRMARIGSWRLDADSLRLDWSDETYRIVGVSPEQFTPTPEAFLEHVHPADRQRLLEVRDSALAGEVRHDATFRIRRPDGQERIVHEIAAAERDAAGTIVALAGTIQDITEQRLAARRNEQYRRLLEASQDLFCVIDEGRRYVMMTEAYARAYGLDRRAAEGAALRELFETGFLEREVDPPLERCFAGEEVRFEAERDFPGTGARHLLIHYFPVPGREGGERLAGVSITDITAFKRAEAELREQARLLSIAGRAARFGGWSVDLRSGAVTWSDMVAEIHAMPHGHAPTVEEGIEFYAPEHRDRIRAVFRACAEAGEPFDEELQIVDATGRRLWVRALGEPVRDEDGTIVRVQGAFQDIDERRRRDERLRKMAHIIEHSPAAIALTDLEARIEYVNPSFETISGYTRDELSGQTPALIQSGHTSEEVYRDLWETITSGHTWYGEIQNRRKDGELYWEYEVISPLTDESGQVTHYVAIKQDISERKRKEQALEDSQAELAALLETRQALINSLPAHIALLGSDGTIVDVNEQWLQFARDNGYPEADTGVGRNYLEIWDAATGDGAEEARQARDGLRAILDGDREQFALEYPCHPAEPERWFRLMANHVATPGAEVAAVVMHLDITEHKIAERRLSQLAYEDTLTGLASRNGFVRALQETLDSTGWQPDAVLIMLDIENQRDLNDVYGFETGDRLLAAVGARLRAELGSGAVVGRTGGDEFAVFLPARGAADDPAGPADVDALFQRPFAVEAASVEISARFGFTRLDGAERRIEGLLHEAELALFRAREDQEIGRWTEYTRDLDEASHHRIEVTRELRRALERHELRLHFQPKVDLTNGHMVSGEALIRWQHPEHGLVSPAYFIPVAEQSQLIGPIGDWALREACRLLAEWRAAGLDLVRVAVNVSVVQFTVGDFAATVADALDAHGVEPSALTLEITESVFEHESQRLRDQLARLHELGVRLSLDDFGTGYSSLLYLQRYPFDEIKIDQGFVRSMLDDDYSARIVTTVVSIAHGIGADLVAEGIEERELAAALVAIGCRVGQGYYYSMPLDEEDFRWLLEQRTALPITAGG